MANPSRIPNKVLMFSGLVVTTGPSLVAVPLLMNLVQS